MKKLISAVTLTVLALACGNSAGSNNVTACKNFLAQASCGSTDLTTQFNCDSYQNTNCDISAYFDCASTHFVCTDAGTYDPNKQSTFGADCASKAQCQ